ncbi:HPr(Ser) kinase/phosphatase [Pseudobacteroides cellulosolvens]|uniref:HPr kinase/phosphorylase n=1 Tax=Pseudobacteroides cellulosolvens ATCC 35603 = DSM 2933 TaxID=398512 RepID=A0A0L6JS25_9FIRM|nr:HPr(Ser) kinase/phosphatase [Pseudobacteroides cellulosolvens]KNY28598.1 HPr kinase [Pseudobacteroides cellulosolvens ATCC 35603 = DSM 2933]
MEEKVFSVSLKEIVEEFQLEPVLEYDNLEDILIVASDVNRPGLQMTGYFEHFDSDRIQVVGNVEFAFLKGLTSDDRYKRLDELFKHRFPCLVVARNLKVFPEMVDVSKKYDVPILISPDTTSSFMSGLISYLNVQLAPRTTKHGVLVEVYGEGILILGESGVGKSETALELVKRGHRLVADDVVEVRRVSEKTLVGQAPDIIRHFIEIRGIGILDVKNLYGVGSVKVTENVKLLIQLELWDEKKQYDRLGLDDKYTDILGIQVPSLTIPVRPGRNLAIIVEVAAMNNRQKKMGYNAAKALNEKVLGEMNKNLEGNE